MGRSAALLVVAYLLPLVGCSSSGPRTINLMPAPAVFAGGAIDPFPDQPPLTHSDFGLLYATDREPSENPDERPFYKNEAGFIVRMGAARIQAGGDLGWKAARRVSLSSRRQSEYPLKLRSVDEVGALDSSYNLLTRTSDTVASRESDEKEFAAMVNQRLESSGVKDVYIYVHGYRVIFDDPVLVAAELWHFMGYRGAFIAYAWPSTPRVLAYMSDLETAKTMARKLRLFITYLGEHTEVEKIHLIGYSAGSRLVVRSLEQLALIYKESSDEQIREELKIGNVIIVGGDISREGFGGALMEGLLRVPERMIIYVSSTDRALRWSRRIFHRKRLGEMWEGDMDPRTEEFLRAHPSLEWVDVTGAAGSSTGNGHDYFRQSPWVSSDILAVLALNLGPEKRGLVPGAIPQLWRFPPDYVQRVQAAVMDSIGTRGNAHGL